MRFFKHFTDSGRGKSLQLLKSKFGMAGIGRYWTLVELCAEKLAKNPEEEYAEGHCTFAFAPAYLTSSLGYGNLKQASTYLGALSDLGLCSVREVGDVIECSMPKLLECIDRDTKRARIVRATSAPKKKNKKENKNKEIETEEEKESVQAFADFWNALNFDLAKVEKVTSGRKKKVLARLTEAPLDDWKNAMLRIGQSQFLLGKNNSGWKVDFDWLIANEENRLKVIEGKYDDNQKVIKIHGRQKTAEAVMEHIQDQYARVVKGEL